MATFIEFMTKISLQRLENSSRKSFQLKTGFERRKINGRCLFNQNVWRRVLSVETIGTFHHKFKVGFVLTF